MALQDNITFLFLHSPPQYLVDGLTLVTLVISHTRRTERGASFVISTIVTSFHLPRQLYYGLEAQILHR